MARSHIAVQVEENYFIGVTTVRVVDLDDTAEYLRTVNTKFKARDYIEKFYKPIDIIENSTIEEVLKTAFEDDEVDYLFVWKLNEGWASCEEFKSPVWKKL
jgi:hypothetical protein